ncbi:hypothetical protein ACOSP7_031792 [Xanthoceras sorbifolium]|uniref:Arabinogalactan-like protein n=1 Tax=Xanthoceras sorbifolium TaxID=99658 RepID=A0ABQ8H5H4_9ROSI|nr:hypothetical protein JRO89_XS14G0162600 [Xanthoceras sorbifolium]
MAPTSVLTLSSLLLLLLAPHTQAQAPTPGPSGPLNVTGLLDKSGQYTMLINLLTTTQVASQIENQATDNDGQAFGLNFVSQNNQVNVSTELVETQINNALSQEIPLAVYPVDKVLLPNELFGRKPPSASPPAKTFPEKGSKLPIPDAKDQASANDTNAGGRINAGLGFVAGLALLCMGVLS